MAWADGGARRRPAPEATRWRSCTAEEMMEEKLDTFPRLMLHHAKRAPDASGDARESVGHLADLDVGGRRRRCSRAGVRAGRAGFPARHASRDHRRQPAAPVLVDVRGAGVGRHSGADVPGRADRRSRLRAERCGDRVRAGRGSGTGGQAARGAAAGALAHAYLFRRSARPAQLPGDHELRAFAGARPRIRSRASGLFRWRSRGRQDRRYRDHAVHVRHDREAEGRLPDPRGVDRRRRAAASNSTA